MFELHGPIAVITLNSPPVNSLGAALRQHIAAAVHQAGLDPAVHAMVLIGNAKAFSAGADVSEFGTPRQLAEPMIGQLLEQIESSQKPMVAAISGVALGGGLELALACHGRVALDTAKLGLPEINLGLIPGAGGTQRLPRLAGMATALTMIQSGVPQTGRQLAESGLLDKVVPDDLLSAALQRAGELASLGAALPRARDRLLNGAEVQQFVNAQQDKLTPRQRLQGAYAAQLDALAAAAGDFDQGLRRERELFLQLQSSTQSKACATSFLLSAKPANCLCISGRAPLGGHHRHHRCRHHGRRHCHLCAGCRSAGGLAGAGRCRPAARPAAGDRALPGPCCQREK
jgi:3-hydroxyacyl-CoA dehydrogenase